MVMNYRWYQTVYGQSTSSEVSNALNILEYKMIFSNKVYNCFYNIELYN